MLRKNRFYLRKRQAHRRGCRLKSSGATKCRLKLRGDFVSSSETTLSRTSRREPVRQETFHFRLFRTTRTSRDELRDGSNSDSKRKVLERKRVSVCLKYIPYIHEDTYPPPPMYPYPLYPIKYWEMRFCLIRVRQRDKRARLGSF